MLGIAQSAWTHSVAPKVYVDTWKTKLAVFPLLSQLFALTSHEADGS